MNKIKKGVALNVDQYKMSFDAISKEDIFDQLEKLHQVDVPENLIKDELSLITQNLNLLGVKHDNFV